MAIKSSPAKQAKHKPAGKAAKPSDAKAQVLKKQIQPKQKSAALKKIFEPKGPAEPKRATGSKPTATAKAPAGRPKPQVPPAPAATPRPDLYSSLHALLHTMRLIERHDEPLCSMHDELKRTGKLSAAQRRRLQHLVDELPAQDYQNDLDTLKQAVRA
jgi:hypothetical protein